MPFSSTDVLQFSEVCELIAGFAGSQPAKEQLLDLQPASDLDRIRTNLAEAGEAARYVQAIDPSAKGPVRLRFDNLPDLRSSLPSIRLEGLRLEGTEILAFFRTLEVAAEYRLVFQRCAAEFPRLWGYGVQLSDLSFLPARWRSAFLPDGRLLDSASALLGRLRRDIEKQRGSIQDSLDCFLRAHRTDGLLQEDFVTIREDRYVVPIVAGQRGRVDGVVHGASGTGRTLYVEPLETVGLNNDLVRLRAEEQAEVERIFAEITGELREHGGEIESIVEALAELDFIFAKAEFAVKYRAITPTIEDVRRVFALSEARHPLLETVLNKAGQAIVPISFDLNEDRRCLLISGPNTGGKTVTMKTAGLLALMAHAGLPVPCDKAEIPLFDDILADVGDSQSIEESLSSFSGHLLHVRTILERVTPQSLVLLDELGRATDPDEGGALGIATLEEFRVSGCFCLASTHLLPLKLYGSKTANVLNASMGFNETTLTPTYELRLGLPGKSAGLDIATRLNIPAKILDHARSVLPRLEAEFSDLLRDLSRQRQESQEQVEGLRRERDLLRKQTERLERESVERERKRQKEWSRKYEELIADFEARALLTIRELAEREGQRGADQAMRAVRQMERQFTEEAATVTAPPPELMEKTAERPPIKEGSRVRLKGVREAADVLRILKNGLLEVQAGLLRWQVMPEDIQDVLPNIGTANKRIGVRVETGPRWNVSQRELNLLGRRAEEAVGEIDRFLDSALLASVDRVRIIHGHGMGVLKRVVAEHLRESPHVGRFYPAGSEEGGSGATIVELRD